MGRLRVFLVIALVAQSVSGKCGHKEHAGHSLKRMKSINTEWPWLASLYHIESQTFFCSGTIISMNHVMTAAHCIQSKGDTYCRKADEILAYFGKYNFSYTHERGSEILYPSEILIHPDWDVDCSQYDADIAILYSDEAIRFKSRVMPIRLWSENLSGSDVGTVVGWDMSDGMSSHGYEEAQVKVIPKLQCYEHYHYFALLSSNRTFCVDGIDDYSSPCAGNAGKFSGVSRGKHFWLMIRQTLHRRRVVCEDEWCLVRSGNFFRFRNRWRRGLRLEQLRHIHQGRCV